MKRLSANIKRALILSALSCASLCFMPTPFHQSLPVCIAAEVNMSDEQKFHAYQQAAEQGDAEAQYKLADCYYNGIGTIKDEKQAVYWWQKAANQGNASAQNNLGACYALGKGVIKDAKQSVYWCKKAAEQGVADAQHRLGLCYDFGKGIDEDKNQAVYW